MLLNSIRSHSSLLLCISVLVTSAYGDCGPPPVKPKTLPIEGTSFKTGTTVDYSCNNNLGYYDIPGMSRTITCLDIDQWSDVLEFCQRACGPPPILKEATLRPEYISNNYFIENATVQYECRFGFVPITDRKNTLTCLTNLTWSTLEEFCKRKKDLVSFIFLAIIFSCSR
ncbi:complement decay-accelerating factor [Bombina bombina]|uniref:complement decay-accelerating factor n=1 Tax=Bombina bombina TaxID=8345 RepID=UPI00235B0119|nr:complement decay-accelerating factor [Bombina bombina]